MDRKALREQIDKAAKLVETWPSWKRNILAQSSQPTVPTPRPQVNNQTSSAQQRKNS